MAQSVKRRVSRLRRLFRWFRIAVWLVILALVVFGIYLNTVGLPDFLKRPLLAKLNEQGVQADFSRMRLRWYRGVVLDDAAFTLVRHPLRPKFSSKETELYPDLRSIGGASFKLSSLTVTNGTLVWPVSKTNESALVVSNINTRIEFPTRDSIDVNRFAGEIANTKLSITADVANLSKLRDWKIFKRKEPRKEVGALARFVDALNKIELSGSPEIRLQLSGDAANPESFKGSFSFTAPAITSPWGSETNLQLSAEWSGFSNATAKNVLRVTVDSAETPWGNATHLTGIARFSSNRSDAVSVLTALHLSAKTLNSSILRADSVELTARAPLSFTNWVPTNVLGKVHLAAAETKWGQCAAAEISFSAETNAAPKVAGNDWATWRHAEPFTLSWKARLSGIESPKLQILNLSCSGVWHAPELQVKELSANLYDGTIVATGALDVATREAQAKGSADFDVQKLSPLLTPFGQRWIAKFSTEKPPNLSGALRAILPSWTNQAPDWRKEVLPTLVIDGHVEAGNGSYRGVSVTSAKTDFVFSNMVWTLPHLRVDRPEGGADVNLVANDRTKEYHWKIHSVIHPNAIRHLLTEKQLRVFDDFQFAEPPVIRADLRGRWNQIEDIAIDGDLVATNFSFRSNAIDRIATSLQLTNRVLSFSEARLDRGDQFATAKKISLDFPERRIFFDNVYGTVDPYLVTRLIGKKVAAHIAPYQFAQTPAIRVDGSIGMTNINDADLHFLVDGNAFRWKNFFADKISGRLDWVGKTLALTNATATAYRGGMAKGWAFFDFAPTGGTEFRFDLAVSDIDLHSFLSPLTERTNHLEGMLHGQFTLDSGNTRDLKTWRGYGRANLRDGLIWDVPIFGIFSPILNALLPGSGNSRAREGSATYVVRNGIVYSDDLEIRASGFRLQYRGAVDFDKRVDARVEAELLRDTWVIGPLISLILSPITKVFEYKVTGTLSDPKTNRSIFRIS